MTVATKRYDEIISKMQNKYGGKKEEEKSSSTTQQVSNQNQGNSTKTKSQKIVDNANARISKMQAKYNPSSQVNESYIRSFMDDVKRFTESSQKSYDSMGYLTASSDYDSRKKIADNLTERSRFISKYLDEHKDSLDEDTYSSFKSYLKDFDMASTQSMYAMYQKKDYFSQWETFDDYNKYVAYQKDYDEKSQYDLDAGQKEIDVLEEELRKLRMGKAATSYRVADNAYLGSPYAATQQEKPVSYIAGNTAANGRPYAAGLQAQQAQYEADPTDIKIRELEKQISSKKQYLNQAKHIQEGITLAGAVDNADFKDHSGYVSTQGEGAWNRLTSEYGLGYEDLTYEYINNQNGIRDEIKQKHRISSGSGGESIYEKNGYDYLNENEIAIYNYYYAKEGKEKAQEYLDNIQETLNIRKATGMFEDMEGNTAQELIFGVAAGFDQFASGMKNAFNTKDDYIAQTAYQIASGMVREDLADDGFKLPDWLGGASLGQVGYDAITTTANMAPSMLSSIAMNMIAPGSGAIVGNAMMFASSAGGAYQEALNLGYDKGSARAYSTLVGASEAGLQYLLGGISSLGGEVSGSVLNKMLNGIDNAFARTALKIGGNMVSEGLEEGLQEILTPLFKNWTLMADEDINWSEVAYSGLLGALTAGFMEGPSTVFGEVNTYKTGRQLQKADISAQRLSDIGKTFSADTVAYQLAGRVNENTGAYTLGRLFNEIGATLTEQNVTEITEALVAKGMDKTNAKKNAQALAYVVEGGQLTENQVAVIEANEVLAEVARTTLIDANTTWNQRAKGYNEALMALAQEKASPKASQTKAAEAGKENAPVSSKVDSQNKNGSEGSSEVDTSPAKVSSITAIQNGKVTIKLEDGSEVSARDADLSPEDGVRIETIAKIDGISAADANTVLNTLRVSTGASAQMDSLGATEAYKYGYYGFSMEHMTKHGVFANSLTDAQRQTIYEVGQRARQQQIEKNTPKKADGTVKQTGIYFDAGNGNVVPYSESNMTLDKKQSAGVQAAMVLRKLGIGGDIYFFKSYVNDQGKRVYKDKNGVERPAPNGWYAKDGSIHIDLNAGNKGEGYVLFTLAHELTHFIEQWSPQKYKVLADFLVENYEKGQSMDQLVRAKQAKLSQSRGKKVSYKEAYSEVVADSMEAMLADGNVLDKLIELKAKDNALFTKMKQFFDNLLKKIRSVYKDLTPDSDEGKAVLEMTDSIEKIQQLFADALMEASDNFRSAEKNTTQESGVNKESAVQRSERIVDQIRNSLQKIMALDSVYTIDASNATPYTSDWKTDEKSGHAVFKAQGGVANRPGFGRVVLSKRGAVHTIHHGNGPAKQAAFPAIKAVVEHGIEIYRDNNHDNQGYDTITFSAPISFFGADSPLAVVVKSFDSANADKAFYIHEICDAEGNYIQLEEADFEQKNSNTNFVEPTSTVSAADNGITPKNSIRNDDGIVKSESTEAMDLEVDEKTESVSPAVLMSERTWTESDYVQERDKAAKEIAKAVGVSEKKAKAYIDSVNSIAKMIADDRTRLDYFSSPGRSSFVGNVEYGGSFDFSTLCKKRRLLTGTFTAIQKALPNTALTANEILDIRNRMKKAGLEVSCGLCYVEGSRANMGQFAKEFLKLYKQYYPDAWQPNMADVNTPDGIEWVRINHPEAYEQYEYFWNHYGTLKSGDKNLFASQQKPKLYQLHTEYKGEILEKFNDDDNVEDKNLNGGIRLQSFSDFEIVHLIDTMQIIMDMSRVGLAGQAYTKVPDFAWALGDTGLKINLSLIAKGVDENGKLIFDDVEGMPIETAVALRNRYSKNVGTILVAFNDEQLLAAMADDRVDFIIPFHRSQWKKSQYEAMGLPAKTKDYTYMQNEKFIKPQYHEYRGRMVKDKATNYMPNEYWDFAKSGKENAEAYLEMCARNNKRPKFYKLLQNNGDGSYSLKADGSTDGYWKLLIDFKMYDNDGNGSPQMPVKPDFNMEEATRMLNDYKGGHSNFPVAQGIVDSFVNEYKDSHEGVQFSDRDNVPTFYSHMARVVDGVKQEKLGASSVVSMLRGKGVKAEEIKWSGIETFLEGKKSVTKAELQEFIAGSMLQIEEETLTDKEMPYSQEHLDQIAKYEAERDTIAETLKSEWKRIVGTNIPIRHFGAGLESAVVEKLLEANSAKKGESEAGYKYKAARAALQRVIEDSDDYYGYDNARQAFREALRNPKDFMDSFELTSFERSVFRDLIKAKEAYSKVEGIPVQDQKTLKAIAESADRFNNRINRVKQSHYAEAAKHLTKWSQYTIRGGHNYREVLFKVPGSYYTNDAMGMHWEEKSGVLAHARIQDLNTFLGKMLFVEEIQSDWHNDGRKDGYASEEQAVRKKVKDLQKQWDSLMEESMTASATRSDAINEKLDAIDEERNRLERKLRFSELAPDAPFSDNYHEYVLKRLIRMAAEQDYDSIGWTPAQIQVERWSKKFAEGYRIEYDQEMPKFLNKYGKKWGTKVGKTVLDNGTEIWSMAITDEMKESVLTEGQPLYSDRDTESVSNRSLLANAFESVVQNDIERNRLQEYKGKISLIESEERKLSELNEQIKELSFAKGPKDTKKIRGLQLEARQTANRINTYDKQLLRLEASLPLQNVLNREKEMVRKRAEQKGKEALAAYRERATKTQRELLDRWQESRKRGIDSRQRTAMRHKIKDVVNDLNQYLLKGTKDRHVPIGLQKAVAEALNAVNMDTVGAEERIAKLQAELMRAKTPDEIQEISKKIDNIREMGDRLDEKLKRLKTAYDEFINSDDPLIANSHDDAVSAHMMRLIVRVGDTPLREMTLDQLQDVYDVYKVVLATIRNANKSFKDNKNREISTRANQVMAEIDNLGVKRGKKPAFMSWIEKFGWDGLKPVYAMEHIGSKGLIDAYNNVRAGEDTWAQDIVEAREYYLEKFRKYKYDSWDFEKKHQFTSTTKKDFELTLDQIMSLYAYSKRDQAADHLKFGGIVFDPKTEVVEKTKSGIKVKYNVANATAYNISEETLADIISTLTDDQKGFVDEMQTYLSDVMGAKGNEVSLAMYDVKLFREKHYFPLKSAHQYMAKAKEQAQGDVKIKNSGFSKETKPHAKNPIVLSSFMDVWSNHVNEMSMYHAFVLPMEDFYRIYNYTTPSKDESMPTEGVVPYIENAYGSGATEYIEQMLKDLNGGARSDSRTGFINKMMGLFKKGAVFASLSVVVQQPSAIARAAARVDTKYFIGPKVDHKRHKALWDEVKQYAPVAIIKEMGYFDTNMGKSTQDYIMGQEYSGFSDKMKALVTDSNYRDEALSKAPALADEIAWCSIWEAVKREAKDANPGMDVTSEEFLKKVGERFTEVIVKTQVYDSVLSRSAMMRSKDTGMKMATAFMAEPTTSINMVADALLKGKRGDRKYARTAIGAVVASQILNSILVSFVYAARDDDEEETYAEKYIGTLTGEVLDSLNPAGYIPFIKDIMSIVQGYDVERSDMAVVSDLWKAWQNLSKDDVSVYRKVEGFAGSIAQIFGLPVKNIMRDARGIYQTVMSFVNSQEKTTKAGIGYAIKGAITGKTATNKEQLYEARVAGDEEHSARVEARYGDTDSADAAVRAAIKDSFMADEIDEATALKQMVLYAGMDGSEAHWLMDEWKYRKTVGSEDGYSKYGRFYDAVRTGKNLKAVVKEYTDNGIKPSTLSGQITEEFKPEYVKMSATQRASMKGYLANAFTMCGVDRETAMEKLAGWDWEAEGFENATSAAIRNYNEWCEPVGISKSVYMAFWEFDNSTENDVDEATGKKIPYSAVKKIMAYINSLNLTKAQKDALAKSAGWEDSTIKKYKLW